MGVVLGVGVLVLVGLALWPASTAGLASNSEPVTDYDAAVAEVEGIRAQEVRDGVINPCLSRLLTHGEKTERAVVLVHGLTNCPKQWELFGREAFRRGWNVLILRLPEHGLGDRATGEIGRSPICGRSTRRSSPATATGRSTWGAGWASART